MNPMDYKPIGFEMQFATTFPVASQWRFSIVFRQWFLPDQGCRKRLGFVKVLAHGAGLEVEALLRGQGHR